MTTRRVFLRRVGGGMLLASLGPVGLSELGVAAPGVRDDDEDEPEAPPRVERLARLVAELAPDEVVERLAAEWRAGVPLDELIAAGALANARRCGGTDYDAYHAFMALVPALEMSRALDGVGAAVPVLKVLHRCARFMDAAPDSARMGTLPRPSKEEVRAAVRAGRYREAEGAFAGAARRAGDDPRALYLSLQEVVRDEVDVHRVVLAWRSYDVLRLLGENYATTTLRQTVRHCVDVERRIASRGRGHTSARRVVPDALDEHGLVAASLGERRPGDAWVGRFADALAAASQERGARDVAAALADGIAPAAILDALALASTRLVLREPGRESAAPGKPVGSVHGAGTGVHACDSVDAWRGIALVGDDPHAAASLVTAAYYVCGRDGRLLDAPFDRDAEREALAGADADAALGALDEGVRAEDQARAAAAAECLVASGADLAPALDSLRGHATRQDGALHSEKFFRTQERAVARSAPAHRAEHLAALARVVASQECQADRGAEVAREVLDV